MMRFAPFTRDFYILKGSINITDKASDCIVYIFHNAKGRPAVMAFHGKAVEPDWNHNFSSDTAPNARSGTDICAL